MLAETTLRSLPGRKGNVAGTFVALTLAVAIMVAAISILVSTFDGPGVAHRLAAAPVVVRVDLPDLLDVPADSVPTGLNIRLTADQVATIRNVDGVERVISDVTFPAQILDVNGMPVTVTADTEYRGQSWDSAALTPFELITGKEPVALGEIVIDEQIADAAGISAGDEVQVVTNTVSQTYRVVGIAQPPDGDLTRQASIFFHPQVASDLADSGGAADVVAVFVIDGADIGSVASALEEAFIDQPVEVLTGRAVARADVTAGAFDVLEFGIIMGVMSGFVGFVAIFVLTSTIGFSIQQREREIGLQRAIGYTPKQVRRAILLETMVLAMLGAGAGIVLGTGLARAFVRVAIWFGKLPDGFTVTTSSLAMLIVAPSAIAIALLAAWLAGRRTTRIRPIEALRSAAAPAAWIGWRRLLMGTAFLGGGMASVLISPGLTPDAAAAISLLVIALLTVGFALLGPLVVVPFVRLLAPVTRLGSGIAGEVATSNARAMAARLASAVTPVILGVGFMTLMFSLTGTLTTVTVEVSRDREAADLYAVPLAAALPVEAAAQVASIEGVELAWPVRPLTVVLMSEHSAMSVVAVTTTASELDRLQELEFAAGSVEDLKPGQVIVADSADFPTTVGAAIRLLMPDGQTREFTVGGVATNMIGLGDLLLAPEDATGSTADVATSVIAVSLAEGADPAGVQTEIEDLAMRGYPLGVVDRDGYVDGIDQSMQDGVWASYLIVGAAAAFGLIAAINTLAMATAERSREFALMRLVGATTAQVRQVLTREAAIVSLIGVVLNWFVAIASTGPVSIGFMGDLSALTVPIGPTLACGLVAAAVVFVTMLLSGVLALRRAPVLEIGRKE